jgi:hypothetical protein
MNSTIVLVEWPMVKNVFVSAPAELNAQLTRLYQRRVMVKQPCFKPGFRRMMHVNTCSRRLDHPKCPHAVWNAHERQVQDP